MQPFKTFLIEKKTYTLTAQENKQVEEILDTYLEYFDSSIIGNYDPRQVYKKAIKDNQIGIGTIKCYDNALKANKVVPVYVSFEIFAADASYDEAKNVIELFYNNFSKLTKIMQRNKIAHELFHAKQHFKTSTPEYRRAVNKRTTNNRLETIRSERGYYFAPNEYPVQVASIVHEMDRQYRAILQKIKQGINNKFWENQRKGFLRLLEQFIRSPKFISDNDIPNYLGNERRFLKTLYRNKDNPKYSKYYKDFKQKMYWYYQNLKKLKATEEESSDEIR